MKTCIPPGIALVIAGLLVIPAPSFAQSPTQIRSMTWTEVNELDAHSLISQLARLVGVDSRSVKEMQLHTQGKSVMISGDGIAASIFNLDDGELLMINHPDRSVIRVDLETLPQLTGEMVDSVNRQFNENSLMAELEAARNAGEIDFTVKTHANARRGQIGEHATDIHYVVVQADMKAPPAGTSSGPVTLYIINELWETDAVPSEASFFKEFAMNVAMDPQLMELANMTGASDPGAASAILETWAPGIGEAMAQMSEQAEQFTGTILRSVIAVSLTPFGTPVALPDLEQMVAMDPEASTATSMVKSAVQEALGGLPLGGLFGGKGKQAPSSGDPAPPYTPYLRMISTRENISYREWEGDVLGQFMAGITGYRAQSLEDVMKQVGP